MAQFAEEGVALDPSEIPDGPTLQVSWDENPDWDLDHIEEFYLSSPRRRARRSIVQKPARSAPPPPPVIPSGPPRTPVLYSCHSERAPRRRTCRSIVEKAERSLVVTSSC